MKPTHDLVVVGGGAGGLVSALGGAYLGAKVALVESASLLGGDCLHFGCVPSKALLHAAERVWTAKQARSLGAPAWEGLANLVAVAAEVQRAIDTIQPHDDPERFRAAGVEVLLGQAARFEGPHLLRVGDRLLKGRKVVLATGSRPHLPPIPGLAEAKPLTNESLFRSLPTLHGKVGIIGAGPIGVEMAQALQRLGLQVLLLEAGPSILPREEGEAAQVVADALRAEGVDLRLGAALERVVSTQNAADGRSIAERGPSWGGPEAFGLVIAGRVEGVDHLVVASGRRPNTEALGLEAAGIQHGPGGILVSAGMESSCPGHYAVGDLAEGLSFTHVAEAQAKVALRNALVAPGGRFHPDSVPWCTFTDPELAQLGPTTAQLLAQSRPFSSQRFPFAQVDRSVAEGQSLGWVQLNLSPQGQLLSATVVGRHAGELIHELALARAHRLGAAQLSGLIHAYPTRSLALRRAADAHQALQLGSWKGHLLKSWVRLRAKLW